MNRILIIEDEKVILKALTRLLERNHFDVSTAMTVDEAIEAQPQSFDLILADLRLPGAEGTEVIPIADPIPVVIMTSHASVRSAVNAMRAGAIDYIAKPFDHDELLLVIERSLTQNRLRSQNQALRQDLKRLVPAENVKQCSAMQPLLQALDELGESQRFVALQGEYGTGRELLARILHANSDRHDAPFVVADLPAIDPARMQAALLGGESPSADDEYMPGGLLHSAHNGTLIIRHPSKLSLELQQSLARALSAGGVTGKAGLRSINVRTVMITDTPLQTQVDSKLLDSSLAGLFRENELHVPPLREMRSDIRVLARHFLTHFQHHHNRQELQIDDAAKAALQAYSWPGNTDELKTVMERAVLITTDNVIGSADLGIGTLENADGPHSRDLSLDEYFRYFVTLHQGSLSETELASRLGISRKALWERRQKIRLLRNSEKN